MDVTQIFRLEPYVGVEAVKFGMSPDEVEGLWGAPDRTSSNALKERVEYRIGVSATYSKENALVELGFPRTCTNLSVRGVAVFSPPKIDRLKELLLLDSQVYEDVGMLVFRSLGISASGYFHQDDSDLAIAAFASGRWDEDFDEMAVFDREGCK